jgi:hypothetical protein
MKLFNKPKWLKPEINEVKYYVHVLVISAVVLLILENREALMSMNLSALHLMGTMFNVSSVLWSIPLITLGDIVAHTILKLD